MKLGTEIVITGVAMCIEMDHSNRTVAGDCAVDRQSNGMVPTGRNRYDSQFMNLTIKIGDFVQALFKMKRFLYPGIPEIGDIAKVIRANPG